MIKISIIPIFEKRGMSALKTDHPILFSTSIVNAYIKIIPLNLKLQNMLWENFQKSIFYYFVCLFAKDKIIPKAIESVAAIKTRYTSGNKNVTVCAGIQKKGIVLNTTNLIK